MLISRNIPSEDIFVNFNVMFDVLKVELPGTMQAEVVPYLETAIRELGLTNDESPVVSNHPLVGLADLYLKALLRYDRKAASELILTAVNNKVEIKEIYSQVFEPCQHEIGRLWQANQLSIAHEQDRKSVV